MGQPDALDDADWGGSTSAPADRGDTSDLGSNRTSNRSSNESSKESSNESSDEPTGEDAPLNEREYALLRVLVDSRGRVVTRSELARRAGLRHLQPRRVDVLLVNVRRAVGAEHLQNVRGRGWMLTEMPDGLVLPAAPDLAAADTVIER